tara:strand:- start:26541 stop:27740 length:1200 start_codon:yes stop_codon:yes gene_type:complete
MKYFSGQLKSGLATLYAGRVLTHIAAGLLGVFLPIFLYTLFHEKIQFVVLFYLVGSLLYMLFVAVGAQYMNKFGFRKALTVGTLFGAIFFVILLSANPEKIFIFAVLAAFALLLHRIFFWLPYHVDFAKFTDSLNRGREVSAMFATRSFLGVLGPIAAGIIISKSGFDILFFIAIFLYVVAAFIFFRTPKVHEKFTWNYRETWKHFCSKEHRAPMLAIFANGAENAIAIVIWPIFIFQLLDGNYFAVGALSTVVVGLTLILQLALGKYLDLDDLHKYKTLRLGSIFYAIGWVAKIFVLTAFHIFIAGLYHGITKIFTRTPFQTLLYDMTADQGHYVDEFTVIREMAMHSGKACGLILVGLLLLVTNIQWAFIIGAVASLLLNLIYYRKKDVQIGKTFDM